MLAKSYVFALISTLSRDRYHRNNELKTSSQKAAKKKVQFKFQIH